jgi:hypothetical protein
MTLFVAILLAMTGLTGVLSPAGGFSATAATLGEYAQRLSFTIAGIQPVVATATSPNLLTVSGRFSNTGPDPIDDLNYRFQRGDRLTSVAAVNAEVADPIQPVTVINPTFRPLPGRVAAKQSAGFTVSVPITGSHADSLGITAPGVYPVMVNVNGTVHAPGGDARARVGEVHLLVTVTAVPGSTLPGSTQPAPGDSGAASGPTPAPVGILWPLVDVPHLGLNGVFRDDTLAAEIKPGGRLAAAVTELIDAAANPNLVTLVVDPMLLDELDRMSHGYWVVAHPGTPQPALQPTPPPTSTKPAPTTKPSTSAQTSVPTSAPTSQPASEATASGALPSSQPSSPPSSPPSNAASNIASPTAGMTDMTPSVGGALPESTAVTAGAPAGATADTNATAAPNGTTESANSGGPNQGGSDGATAEPTGEQPPGNESPGPPEPIQPAGPQPAGTVAGTGQEAAAAFLDQLRGLAETHHVLVLPYGDPDVVALVRAGMSDVVATAVFRGRAVASRVLGQGLDTPTAPSNLVTDVADPPGGVLTDQAWQVLRSLGYRSAILDPTAVHAAGSPGPTGSSSKVSSGFVTVSVDGDQVPAVLTSGGHAPELARVLDGGAPADWADAVNTLAAVMMVESSAAAGPMVVAPPRGFAPHGAGFATLSALLDDLSGVGMVVPSPVTALARDVVPHGIDAAGPPLHVTSPTPVTLDYGAKARAAELPASYLERLIELRQRLDVLGVTLGAASGGPDPADILAPLSDAMLGAASASWRGTTDPDEVVLQSVDATVDGLYAGVKIARDTGSYTLASSTAPLLLTVHNTLPYQVTMTVRVLGGEQAGLTTQDPGRIVIGAGPRSAPVRIHATVSRSGTFTVYAQLQGADGSRWGGAVPLKIDSRAYGALTVVLMAVAGGVLLLMVIWRLVQRWRGRAEDGPDRPITADGAHSAHGADGADGADDTDDTGGACRAPETEDTSPAPRAANSVIGDPLDADTAGDTDMSGLRSGGALP